MDNGMEINGLQDSPLPPPTAHHPTDEKDDDFLELSLSSPDHHQHRRRRPLHAPTSLPQLKFTVLPPLPATKVSRAHPPRRNPSSTPGEGKIITITPPFPWSTDLRATVHDLNYLLANQITTITGDVQCNKCEKRDTMSLDLEEKFDEVTLFIVENKPIMNQRAPRRWTQPNYPICRYCRQNDSAIKPVISDKKRSINWLFMMLGQTLGACTLEQLKYFCKHTKNHRTGAKDRVLYMTYLFLCKQLYPNGPFDI